MPRRLITSDIFSNEKFGDLCANGRLLYIGMITNADDEGRLKGSPKYLKANIFPYDNDVTVERILEWRNLCQKLGLIQTYSPNGTEYIYLTGWEEHQSIRKDRIKPSKLPPPDNHLTTT